MYKFVAKKLRDWLQPDSNVGMLYVDAMHGPILEVGTAIARLRMAIAEAEARQHIKGEARHRP